EKGEDVDSSWLIKKVLCKFPDALKRKVIAKKQGSASTTPFSMSLLFQYLDEVISTEELFLMFSAHGGRSSITKDIRNAGSGPVDASRKEKVRENNGSNGRTTMKVKSHAITTPENEELAPADKESVETAVIQQHSTPNKISPTHPCLPIGEVTVVDTRTRALMTVNVLLDTGAELSFIDSALAEQLQLPIIAVKDVQLMTFGSDEVRKCRCNRVRLDVWDIDGNPHTLDLFTYHILTRPLESPTLTVDDMEFLRSSGLPITGNQNRRKIKPSILLGCDQLWEFVRSDKTSISLPSGMHVLPTKIGYLVSGKPTQNGHKQVFEDINSAMQHRLFGSTKDNIEGA
ncbi:Tas retrotransposon peptidase A16, partial [Ostertagia ostertagi]